MLVSITKRGARFVALLLQGYPEEEAARIATSEHGPQLVTLDAIKARLEEQVAGVVREGEELEREARRWKQLPLPPLPLYIDN